MALPYERQKSLVTLIYLRDLTVAKVADYLGVTYREVASLTKGGRYPSPDELRGLAELFGLPVETFLDAELLRYRHETEWPPTGPGFRGPKRAVEPYPDPAKRSDLEAN